eukprot:TRINITY_DN1269_c0_g1_i6.p1 TRINITY_DN1269_c0_g1~~TRINITY_DN1269_c0_g1_i6.p1  ORF type:complete len:225 (-),score=31.08 TRINITY_DN1269_c0_g1_i6:156-830(-)
MVERLAEQQQAQRLIRELGDEYLLNLHSKKITKEKKKELLRRIFFENQRLKQVVDDLGINYSSAKTLLQQHRRKIRSAQKCTTSNSKRCSYATIIPGQMVNLTIETTVMNCHEVRHTEFYRPFRKDAENLVHTKPNVIPELTQDRAPPSYGNVTVGYDTSLIRNERELKAVNLMKSARILLKELCSKITQIKELIELETKEEKGLDPEVLHHIFCKDDEPSPTK